MRAPLPLSRTAACLTIFMIATRIAYVRKRTCIGSAEVGKYHKAALWYTGLRRGVRNEPTSPVILPLLLRRDRMSRRVDFPAPLGPSSARHSPGLALPNDGCSTCASKEAFLHLLAVLSRAALGHGYCT